MTRVKPAEVRYYFDADILGLAKVLSAIRADVTYPGDPGAVIHKRRRPPCPVTSASVKDEDWIELVTQRGWLIVTRDRRIQDHRREVQAVRQHGARMVGLAGAGAGTLFEQLEVVMCQWRRIERLLVEPGPFIVAATRTQLRPVPLD